MSAAAYNNILQHAATRWERIRRVSTATHCNKQQHTASHCHMLKEEKVSEHSNTLHTATRCNTHCNTQQHAAAH